MVETREALARQLAAHAASREAAVQAAAALAASESRFAAAIWPWFRSYCSAHRPGPPVDAPVGGRGRARAGGAGSRRDQAPQELDHGRVDLLRALLLRPVAAAGEHDRAAEGGREL